MKFTGERVIIGDMKNYITTLQEHITRYNFALHPALNKKVLDAACGTGYGTKLLSEATTKVTGVDVSQEAVAYASKLYPGIEFGVMDLNKTFPSEKFDLCISFETIEHLEKPEVFLKNVADNCDVFLFSIPISRPSKYHVNVWNKEEIHAMISKYWSDVRWFHQMGSCIFHGDKNATFLLGTATN